MLSSPHFSPTVVFEHLVPILLQLPEKFKGHQGHLGIWECIERYLERCLSSEDSGQLSAPERNKVRATALGLLLRIAIYNRDITYLLKYVEYGLHQYDDIEDIGIVESAEPEKGTAGKEMPSGVVRPTETESKISQLHNFNEIILPTYATEAVCMLQQTSGIHKKMVV